MTARRGLIVVFLVALAFFAGWWNAYVPPTSGGEAALMTRWAGDVLPYRDYFYQAPPGIPMLLQAITAVAGPHLLATATFGALLRVAASCAVYALLLRVARPSYAALGTLTALFLSSTDISDTTFYYNHLGAALVLIGTYLGVVSAAGTRNGYRLIGIAAGALITFAVAVKQTMIFGAAGALVALVLLVLPRPRVGWAAWIFGLVAGAAITVGGTWAWLASHHLVDAMFFVMRRAPEGKGGIARSLFRPLSLLVRIPDAFYVSAVAWVVIAIVATLWVMHRQRKTMGHGMRLLCATVVAVLVGGLAGFPNGRTETLFLTALAWWGSLAVALVHLRSVAPPTEDRTGRAFVALGILSFSIGYCFAVSWPLFENFAFPGFALVIAAILERPPSVVPRRWVAVVVLLCCASMSLSGYRKFASPHSWGAWLEPPIYSARGGFEHPVFAGMRISEPSADLYAMVSRIVRQSSTPDDRIYVFPNLPILYAIAERRPATYALVHWVDTCPDFLGKDDAARLRAAPPKLLIVREDSMFIIEVQESLYRGGARSSVRDVVAALDEIKPLYDKVAVFSRAPTVPIAFYVRRDARR